MAASRMLVSLRHRNARRFFLGLLLSNVGTWMQMTASSLVIYQLTGRATDTGINLLCQFLPMLLLGSWAGAVADRRDKRRMALLTQGLLAAQALLLGVITLVGWVSLPVFFAMSLALGVIGAFDNPARRGFVLELVEPHEISNAVALNTAVMTGSRIVGPALAAFLEEPLGAGWLFVANGVSFLFLLVPLVRIDTADLHPSPTARRGGTPVRDALRFITSDPRLLRMFAVFAIVSTFAFNYSVSLLKIADQRFDDETMFGVLLAMTGVGSLIGSLLTAGREQVTVAWFYGSGVMLGFAGLSLAWAPSAWSAGRAGRHRRSRFHRRTERSGAAGGAGRHAWPVVGPRGRCLPRQHAGRIADHGLDRRPRGGRVEPRIRQSRGDPAVCDRPCRSRATAAYRRSRMIP